MSVDYVSLFRLPLAFDIVIWKKNIWDFIRWSCISAVLTLVSQHQCSRF